VRQTDEAGCSRPCAPPPCRPSQAPRGADSARWCAVTRTVRIIARCRTDRESSIGEVREWHNGYRLDRWSFGRLFGQAPLDDTSEAGGLCAGRGVGSRRIAAVVSTTVAYSMTPRTQTFASADWPCSSLGDMYASVPEIAPRVSGTVAVRVASTSNSRMRLPIPKSSTLPRPSGITITLAPHDQLHRDE
jgi:hypothetical protein